MNKRQLYSILISSFLIRIGLILFANNIIDIHNYDKVATIILNNGISALYVDTKGIYPYPPLWVIIEVFSKQISEIMNIDFGFVIRVPIIIADVGVNYLIILLYHRFTFQSPKNIGYFYAFNPVSIIITCFHGQFDAIAWVFIGLSLYLLIEKHQITTAALMLSIAIALKSFPVLLILPMITLIPRLQDRIRFLLYATIPVGIILIPFLIISYQSVISELIQYKGVALLGIMVPIRTIYVSLIGTSFPVDTTQTIMRISSIIYIIVYTLYNKSSYHKNISITTKIMIILGLFYTIHAGISPQYSYWIIPVLLMSHLSYRTKLLYNICTMGALLGFYLYAVPEIFPITLNIPLPLTQIAYGLFGTLWWGFNVYLVWGLLQSSFSLSAAAQPTASTDHD